MWSVIFCTVMHESELPWVGFVSMSQFHYLDIYMYMYMYNPLKIGEGDS